MLMQQLHSAFEVELIAEQANTDKYCIMVAAATNYRRVTIQFVL